MEPVERARRLVVDRNLAPAAFGYLTADAFMALPFDALRPTKGLLKRYFSGEPWTAADAHDLAEVVGPGEGWWSHALDDEVTLEFGWEDGRFAVRLSSTAEPEPEPEAEAEDEADSDTGEPLLGTVDGPVVPEATPNPRTMRFRTGQIHGGESQWFDSPASGRKYWRAARLFDEFPEVANILVGQDFVAVSLHRAGDWERVLGPMLAAITDVFEGAVETLGEPAWMRDPVDGFADRPRSAVTSARATRLAKAWADLGPFHPADPDDLPVVLAAAEGDDAFHRQVAANLLLEADPAVAARQWERLIADSSRAVRRAATDAIADAGREDLRPLLERALGDDDGWVRWKALRGLNDLGPEPSREVIASLVKDPDFRVRLEVMAALKE